MGYYTHYGLEAEPWPEKLSEAIEAHDELPFAVDRLGKFMDRTKWYDHEKDMVALSKQFPGVLFTLHGQGEEPGDLWVKNFRDGKIQRRKAQVVIPLFDEAKWEDLK